MDIMKDEKLRVGREACDSADVVLCNVVASSMQHDL